MVIWLWENLSTILVGLLLLLATVYVIRLLIRDRKSGKMSCCGQCAGCPMGQSCKDAAKCKDPTDPKSEQCV